ncbi:MAG: hypothetical protein LBG65_02770 [Puniceicoccales bacterium]|jgi:hypothetical protein|nr:hypothetical protein [Puniceicoccales bacterium]
MAITSNHATPAETAGDKAAQSTPTADTPPKPSFRDLTPAILGTLQAAVEAAATSAESPAKSADAGVAGDGGAGRSLSRETSIWTEKLLRYCEINPSILRQRAREKWGAAAPEIAGRIASLFANYHRATGDLRYLNAALKLADARWTSPPPALRPLLESALARLSARLLGPEEM